MKELEVRKILESAREGLEKLSKILFFMSNSPATDIQIEEGVSSDVLEEIDECLKDIKSHNFFVCVQCPAAGKRDILVLLESDAVQVKLFNSKGRTYAKVSPGCQYCGNDILEVFNTGDLK